MPALPGRTAAASALGVAAALAVASGACAAADQPAALSLALGIASAVLSVAVALWIVLRRSRQSTPSSSGTVEERRALLDTLSAAATGDDTTAADASERVTAPDMHGALVGALSFWSLSRSVAARLALCGAEETQNRQRIATSEEEIWQRTTSGLRLCVRSERSGSGGMQPEQGADSPLTHSPLGFSSLRMAQSQYTRGDRQGTGSRGSGSSELEHHGRQTSRDTARTSKPAGRTSSSDVLELLAGGSSSGERQLHHHRRRKSSAVHGSEVRKSPSSNSGRVRTTQSSTDSSSCTGGTRAQEIRRQSFLGRQIDSSSSGSSSDSEGRGMATAHSSAKRSVLTMGGRPSMLAGRPGGTQRSPGTSGVVTGAKILGRGRRGSSSSGSGEDPVDTALRTKPASVALYRAGLSSLPLQVCTELCHNLTALDISNNKLRGLPKELGKLTLLTELVASSNQLLSLPEEINELGALRKLHVQHNNLSVLPPVLPASLEDLHIAWNELGGFPMQVLQLPRLSSVDITENADILQLPSDVCAWAQLPTGCTLRLDNEPSLVADVAGLRTAGVQIRFSWNAVFPDKIIPGLFLGPLRSAQDRVYDRLGITHVATIGSELDVRPPSHIQHLKVAVDDVADNDIRPLLAGAHNFIDGAREQGGACFVHCFKGQSRSATVVVSYLMVTQHRSLASALAFVRQARPMIRPNEGFLMQIARIEEALELDHNIGTPKEDRVLHDSAGGMSVSSPGSPIPTENSISQTPTAFRL
eukprot:TRINITY_DN1546_c0_g3_i1.p1 TRINITY_DN1546_c0_g3~~TRINITY_DN1546_c0_g3_i1.p1  ORF type:complete len:783 (+),score=173.80 TRINITY_DN1546_c0_g3_i1:79-2349(+)